MTKQFTFREYLQGIYAELMEDEFEEWADELETTEIIDYANNWGETLTK